MRRYKEICRNGENNLVCADLGQGGKYLVLMGKGKIEDLCFEKLQKKMAELEPQEAEKLRTYLRD